MTVEEGNSSPNFRRVHSDGPEGAACGPGVVPTCSAVAGGTGALWETCTVVGVRGDAAGTASEAPVRTSPASSREQEVRDRRDCCGGGSVECALESVPCEVGGVRAAVGSVEDSGAWKSRRSGRDVGATEHREEHAGVPDLEGAQCGYRSLAKRACPGCGSELKCNEGNSGYALCCDGEHHVGPRSIKHSQRFSCFSCGR